MRSYLWKGRQVGKRGKGGKRNQEGRRKNFTCRRMKTVEERILERKL